MYTYPLLEHVKDMYQKAKLGNVLLLACQHLLEPQKRMFEHLLSLGLKPENCVIVGKNYSTNNEIMRELGGLGCCVAPFSNEFDPLTPFDLWFERKLTDFITKEISRRPMSSYDKVIILDDGGFMHLVVQKLCKDFSNVVGIEQTSSGHHRITQAQISFPFTSVARSYQKLMYESPFIGRCAYERILFLLRKLGRKDPNILVLGLGPVGSMVAGNISVLGKFKGAGVDPHYPELFSSPFVRYGVFNVMHLSGWETVTTMENLSQFDVVVGTSGTSVFCEKDLDSLHPNALLVSVSSSDREFPACAFRHKGGDVHQMYSLEDRMLVNGGFPITFDGLRHGMPPQQIEFTISLLMMWVLSAAHDVPSPLPAYVMAQVREMWNPHEGADEWYANFHNGLL